MKTFCKQTRWREHKKPGTKTVWVCVDKKETKVIDRWFYDNVVEASPFFRHGLGGHEYVERNYTKAGYVVVKIISTSPDKTERTIRIFHDFI